MIIMGRCITFKYHVREECYGPKRITVNGTDISHTPVENQYRAGGVAIDAAIFTDLPPNRENRVDVYL